MARSPGPREQAEAQLGEEVSAAVFLVPVGTYRQPVAGAGAAVVIGRDVVNRARGIDKGKPIGTPAKTLMAATPTRLALFEVTRSQLKDCVETPFLLVPHAQVADLRTGGNKLNSTRHVRLTLADGQHHDYEVFRAHLNALGAVGAALGLPSVADHAGVPRKDIYAMVAIVVIIVATVIMVLVAL